MPMPLQREPISLAKVTFKAWKPLQAYLSISATSKLVLSTSYDTVGKTLAVSPPREVGTPDRGERRMIKIVYRTAFTEEFRVKTNVEIYMCRFLDASLKIGNQYVAHGAWQHGASKNDAVIAFLPERFSDLPCHCLYSLQIKTAIAIARCPDTDERDLTIEHRFKRIRGSAEAAANLTLKNNLRQTLLNDRTFARVDHSNFVGVDIDPQNVVAALGQQAAVTQPT